MLEPTNLAEAKDFALTLSKSGLVPKDFQGKPANILVAVQWGYEIGLAPMQALQNIAVINGRPSLWGDSLLALVKGHKNFGGCKETMEGDTAVCEMVRLLPNGKEELTRATFSKQDAEKARLWNKQGPWQQYPKRMLQLRARGFAIRDAFPDAIKGLITAEEAQDFPTQPVDITPKEGTEQAPSLSGAKTTQELMERIQQSSEEPGKDEQEEMPDDADELFYLHIPGVDKPEGYNFGDDWVHRYAELQLGMANCSLPAAERRHKLKELEEANLAVMDLLEQMDKDSPHNKVDGEGKTIGNVAAVIPELKEKRLNMNKHLSMQAKEEEDKDGSTT